MAGVFDAENFVIHVGSYTEWNGELYETELFWRKHCQFLKDRGYTLRPRYQPDWIPSWWNTSQLWIDCEDGKANAESVLDATCADSSIVMLKAIDPREYPDELRCGKLLSSERFASPRNRCIPYLEVLEPEGSDMVLIVIPYLIRTEDVPFETIGEAVEFFRQIFEGLEFMHENNIIHGDCKYDNIMADAIHLYDAPPHPHNSFRSRDYSRRVSPVVSRTKKPVKYYLIDFGLSKEYPPGVPRLRPTPWGGDKSVPEHKLPDFPPCDPFPVDVYCLGNHLREDFLDGRRITKPKQGFEFMRELVDDMTNPDPSKRPTMKEAASRLNAIIEGLNDRKLRSPILEVGRKLTLRQSIVHWTKQYILKVRGVPAIPRP